MLEDIETMKKSIADCQKQEQETKANLVVLGQEREQKCAELEAVRVG